MGHYKDYESAQDEPWYPLASGILEATVVQDEARVISQFTELVATYGMQGLNRSMQIWADMALEATGVPQDAHEHMIALGFYDEAGEVVGADDVDPVAAWCGRMLAARAADDAEQWAALVTAVQRQGTLMPHIVALLNGTAKTLVAYFQRRIEGDLEDRP